MASPSLSNPCPPKTRADLEWDRLLGALADRCASAHGRDAARALAFPSTSEGVQAALAETREAVVLHEQGQPVPVGAVPDVRVSTAHVRVGGVLGAIELRELAQALDAARSLRRFLHSHRESCPALGAACATDPTLDAVADEIAECFE